MTIKEAVRPYYAAARRHARSAVDAAHSRFTRLPRVAHQGIQRSGTNYLCALLSASGYFVENSVDPRRDNPRHKHFRWQDDKTTITMDRAFSNSAYAGSIEELNAIAGFSPDTRHIVIFKDPHRWLPSILRWGRVNGWIDRDATIRSNESVIASWLREWDQYYAKWFALHDAQPEAVAIVSYEHLSADPHTGLAAIRDFMQDTRPLTLRDDGYIAKVPHSARRESHERGNESQATALVDKIVSPRWREFR